MSHLNDELCLILALALASTSCGRIGYEAREADANGPDRPFSPPAGIAALDDGELYEDATVTGDLLEMYVISPRQGGAGAGDVWLSRRATSAEPWPPPVVVPELGSPGDETDPEVSADGLTMWLSSDRAGDGNRYELWMATRPDRQSAWSTPLHVMELGTPDDEFAPTQTASELHLLFARELQGQEDIFESMRTMAGQPWSDATLQTELDTPFDDAQPSISPDGLSLLFASSRPGGSGDRDIYFTSRPGLNEPFAAPVRIDELASAAFDGGPWMAADGSYVVFTSERSGRLLLYEAFR